MLDKLIGSRIKVNKRQSFLFDKTFVITGIFGENPESLSDIKYSIVIMEVREYPFYLDQSAKLFSLRFILEDCTFVSKNDSEEGYFDYLN